HRPRNVLEVLLAHIVERDFDFSLCVFLHPAGNADSARVRKRLQTCHYIHAITPEITVFNDKFAKVDAYAEFDPLILRRVRIVFGHASLNLDGAAYRVDDARNIPSPITLTIRPRCSFIFGSMTVPQSAFHCERVPSSSASTSRLYPAISAARMAVSRRS